MEEQAANGMEMVVLDCIIEKEDKFLIEGATYDFNHR
jgi:hypothetical protein